MSRNEANNNQEHSSKTMTFANKGGVRVTGRFHDKHEEELTLRDNGFYSMTY